MIAICDEWILSVNYSFDNWGDGEPRWYEIVRNWHEQLGPLEYVSIAPVSEGAD